MNCRRASRPATAHGQGFSLIELMITITVAAVLLSLAIPSFRDLIARNELTTAANAWVGAINTARSEAIKRNQLVALCGEDDVPTNGVGSASDGHEDGACSAALAGQVRHEPRDGGNAETLQTALADAIDQPVEIAASTTVRFRGDGIGYRGDNTMEPYNTAGGDPPVVVLCSPVLTTDNARRVELIAGSTVQIVTETRTNCP
ncbi:MAG TPA: GspH/FimT family pseudopilin [Wenzhouxiangella sp.]|nr:GspH/FimT family pseudopilin [Wenzhouxiangella sp.]